MFDFNYITNWTICKKKLIISQNWLDCDNLGGGEHGFHISYNIQIFSPSFDKIQYVIIEFLINSKPVAVTLNFSLKVSKIEEIIECCTRKELFIVPHILEVDFPELINLKNKISTYLLFL